MMPACATKLFIEHSKHSNKICTSISIWRTTFCSRELSNWKRKHNKGRVYHGKDGANEGDSGRKGGAARTQRGRGSPGGAQPRSSNVQTADDIHPIGPGLHGVPGDVPGCVEPAPNQRTRERCVYLSCLAAGPRSCTSVRMGREFYLGNRLLFHPEDARRSEIFIRNGMDELGDVDDRRGIAVGRKCVLVGVEIPSAVLCFSGIRGISHFLPRSFPASAGSFR